MSEPVPAPVVTLDLLRAAGACDPALETFLFLFGTSAEVTAERCAANAGAFPWGWAAANLLTRGGQAAYRASLPPHTCPSGVVARAERFAECALAHGLRDYPTETETETETEESP